MASTHKWNYDVAIPAFKAATRDPINGAYSPYGLPYYAIIAAMMAKSKKSLVNEDYDFKIENGRLVRTLGPSLYPGSKMYLNDQPRPLFRPWHEYIQSAIKIIEEDYPTAAPDYKVLSDKITTLYNKYLSMPGTLSPEALTDAHIKKGVFANAGDETFYYNEQSGYHLELRQEGGGTEICVGMDIKTGKINTTILTRAHLNKKADYDKFIKFVTVRKKDVEKYALGIIPLLKNSPHAQNDTAFTVEAKAMEKDIETFYNKYCKTSIDMLRNANQLQQII